jgi:hypothetical protein
MTDDEATSAAFLEGGTLKAALWATLEEMIQELPKDSRNMVCGGLSCIASFQARLSVTQVILFM